MEGKKSLIFRISISLWEQLADEALKSGRSFSEELRVRLERSLTLSKQEELQLGMAELTASAEKALDSIKAVIHTNGGKYCK